MTMLIHEGWQWDPDTCPADRDFVDFIHAENIVGKNIFHMGPGAHHYVGRSLQDNHVISLTNSPDEIDTYIGFVSVDPYLGERYYSIFGDIQQPRLLPQLDVITLFHLGETPDQRRAVYSISEIMTIRFLLSHLRPGGMLVGYKRSAAFDRMGPSLASVAIEMGMYWKYDYESLKVWVLPE